LVGQGTIVSDVSEDSFYGIVQTDIAEAPSDSLSWDWHAINGLIQNDENARAMCEWFVAAMAPYDINAYPGVLSGCVRKRVMVSCPPLNFLHRSRFVKI
jgi:hypothetical protein